MPRYRFLTISAVAATLAFANLGAEAQLRYRVELAGLHVPGTEEEFFSPAAISNRGVVVGTGYRETEEIFDTYPIAHILRSNGAQPLPGTGARISATMVTARNIGGKCRDRCATPTAASAPMDSSR